jgi:chemotaxis protein histidine kinase CheA
VSVESTVGVGSIFCLRLPMFTANLPS